MSETLRRLISFIGVGAAGTLAYVVVSTMLAETTHWPHWAISLVTYALLIPIVYRTQHGFAFRAQTPHRTAFPRYVSVQAVGLILATLLPIVMSWLWTGLPSLMVFLTVASIIAVVNFLLLSLWAFAAPNVPEERAGPT